MARRIPSSNGLLLFWVAFIACTGPVITTEASTSSARQWTVGAIFDRNDEVAPAVFEAAIAAANGRGNLPGRLVGRIFLITRNNVSEANSSACALLSGGIVAIITDAGPAVSRLVSRLSDNVEVPHINLGIGYGESGVISLHLHPNLKPLAAGMAVRGLPTDSPLGIISDDPRGEEKFRKVMRKLDRSLFSFRRWNRDTSNQETMLASLKQSGVRHFVIDIPNNNVKAFLRVVRKLQMDTSNNSFIFICPDTVGLEVGELGPPMRATIKIVTVVPHTNPGQSSAIQENLRQIVVGVQNDSQAQIPTNAALIDDAILLLANKLKSYSQARTIVVNNNLRCSGHRYWSHGIALLNYLKMGLTQENGGVTGAIAFNYFGHRTPFLPNVYTVNGARLETQRFSQPRRIVKREIGSAKAKTLRVVTYPLSPYITRSFRNRSEKWDGFLIQLLNKMAKKGGFTYTIYQPKRGAIGIKRKNKRWDGMIGELMDGKADIALFPMIRSSKFEQVVDFSAPVMTYGTKILAYRLPQQTQLSPLIFLQPFTSTVWVVFLIAFVLVSFILFIVGKLTPYEWKHPHHGADVRVNNFSLLSSFWFAISGCLRQYSGIAPRSTSVRVVAGTWWLVVLLFFLYYVVCLVPLMSKRMSFSNLSTFKDLLESNVKFGTKRNSDAEYFLKNSKNPVYRSLWFKMSTTPGSMTDEVRKGVEKVYKEKGKYAFIGDSDAFEKLTNKNCSFISVGEMVNVRDYAFALPQGSPYLDDINVSLMKLKEMREVEALRLKFWEKQKSCEVGWTNVLSMNEMSGIFVLLLIGVILGILCAILECFWRRCCRKDEAQAQTAPLSDIHASLTTTRKATA